MPLKPKSVPTTSPRRLVCLLPTVICRSTAFPADETKRKMRDALAAKKARHGEDHLDGGQNPGHAHGRVETKRTFRRKTG